MTRRGATEVETLITRPEDANAVVQHALARLRSSLPNLPCGPHAAPSSDRGRNEPRCAMFRITAG